MADHGQRGQNDDDLLANAIPIPPEAMEDDDELKPIEFDDGDSRAPAATGTGEKIQAFGVTKKKEGASWKQRPVSSGTGARHVKTFVAKLRLDAIDHLDHQINDWLDQNPDFDVKFATTTIGQLVGKNTEDALFVNVWV